MKRIVARAIHYRVILVRGTPGCGKSILLELVAWYLKNNRPEFKVINILQWNSLPGNPRSETLLKYHTGMTYRGTLNSPNTIILIDEGQETYRDYALWQAFKLKSPSSAIFILFSSYGSAGELPVEFRGTPEPLRPAQRISFLWEPRIGDPEAALHDSPVGLYLQAEEAIDLIKRYPQPGGTNVFFATDACKYLFEISGGHAGALAGLVEQITTNKVSIPFYSQTSILCSELTL